jgi:hypothetical protein
VSAGVAVRVKVKYLDNERAIFVVIVRRQTLISAKVVVAGSISATTRCYEPKKRAHETLFGGEACSSAHCTLCNLNAFAIVAPPLRRAAASHNGQ